MSKTFDSVHIHELINKHIYTNIYISDIPTHPKHIQLITYTTFQSLQHTTIYRYYKRIKQLVLTYDPTEYNIRFNLQINNFRVSIHTNILGLTFNIHSHTTKALTTRYPNSSMSFPRSSGANTTMYCSQHIKL